MLGGERVKIEIFYSLSCGRCRLIETVVHTALEDLGLEADVEKCLNPAKAFERGARAQPAMWVNDKLLVQGQVPLVSEMREILKKQHMLETTASRD